MKIAEYVCSALVIAVIVGLLIFTFICFKRSRIRGKDSPLSGIWWLVIFVCGFVLYCLAYIKGGKLENQTELSFKLSIVVNGFVSAICLFCFVFNYQTVSVIANGNSVYLIAVILCFVAGSVWTLRMMQRLFFKGVVNSVAVWLQRILPRRKNTVRYVVVGSEKSARLFIDSLCGGENKVPKRLITVITGERPDNLLEESFKDFVGKGFRVIAGKADETALLHAGVGANKNIVVVVLTESNEQNIEVAEILTKMIFKEVFKKSEYAKRTDDVDFQRLVMEALAYSPIDEGKKPQEYERNRASEEEKRAKLLPVQEHVKAALEKIKLRVRVKYSFIERTEHFVFAQNAFGRLDFFNPYEMRAREFFFRHPVTEFLGDYIDTDKGRLRGEFDDKGKILKADGTPYKIKNIFVGYGNANYHMLKWSVLTGQLLGCDYNAVVFDENVKDGTPSVLQSMFKNQACGLFPDGYERCGGEYLPSPEEEYNIEFLGSNILSDSFYGTIRQIIGDSDFTAIYIALGDDSKDIETACEIRQVLREYNIPLNKVRLFAKVSKNTALNSDLVINNIRNIDVRIETFGAEEEVYSKENVIGDTIERYAQTVSNTRGLKWELLSETERDSNRQVAIHLRTKLQLIGFDLADASDAEGVVGKEEYDKAYGISDKNVREIIENRDKLKYLVRQSYVDENFVGENDPVLDTPRNNLARLEHLRWNTFNLVAGWTKKPINKIGAERVDKIDTDDTGRKNEYTKQHACITTFEGLIELRRIQAEQLCKLSDYKSFEDAEKEADTVNYDFSTMDELFKRLPADKRIVKLYKGQKVNENAN